MSVRLRTERALLALLLCACASPLVAAQAEEIVVSHEGAISSVALAVRSAPAGATVRILPGIYHEPPIVIERPLRLIGEAGAILDGNGDNAILTVRANDVTISRLHFRNVAASFIEDRAAVRVVDAERCALLHNRFDDTFFGIYLENVEDCRIERNVLTGAGSGQTGAGNGIHAWHSRRLTIVSNQIRGHRDGIYFEFVEDGRVENNISASNHRYGLHFMFSDGCHYTNNTFAGNASGVAVMYGKRVVMRGNSFEHNRGTATYGLLLKDIMDSELDSNRFIANTVGLLTEGSNRLVATRNDFRENGWAVKVMANATDNRFADNQFFGNTFDVATNSRHTSSTFEGNYWDAYTGYDLDRDGFGDVPFRPVRLFALIVERHPPALALLRGLFIQVLDAAERVLPVLTPATLVDARPRMSVRVEEDA